MKTIKEIDKFCNADGMGEEEAISIWLLKQSAIEDVKRFKKDIEYEEDQAELNKGISYVVRCVCLTRIFELKSKIEYIIEKFNLTNEDTK